MNVTVKNSNLAQELKLLSRVSPEKTTIPALRYVHIETDGDALRLTATDLEIGLRTSCPASVTEHGATTIPARRFLELMGNIPEGEITIAFANDQVVISAGSFRSRLQTLPARDFPDVAQVEGTAALVPAVSLGTLVERVKYAITEKSDQRFVLQGALLSLSGSVAAMVATDGKRISLATTVRPEGPDLHVVVPSKTLDILSSLCESGDVEVTRGDRHIFFAVGKRVLISRTLDGQFPKYDKIIPRDADKRISVDRSALAAVLRRVCVVADDQLIVSFEAVPGALKVASRSAGVGDAAEDVMSDYSGEPVRVLANGKHVLDFLEHASERTITLAVKSSSGPILLTDGSDYLNVVLVRTS